MANGFRRGNGLIKPSPSSSTASVASRWQLLRRSLRRTTRRLWLVVLNRPTSLQYIWFWGNFLLKTGGKISILLGRMFPPRPPSSTCRSGVRSQELAYQGRSFDHSVRFQGTSSSSTRTKKIFTKKQREVFWLKDFLFRVFFRSHDFRLRNGNPLHAPIWLGIATPSAYCLLLWVSPVFYRLYFRNWPDPWWSYEACLTPQRS